ncbi:hypothetical protein AG1IA_06191 [Rhizoctonia solani AG-1 IA]|uniref:Uncharacterized protein n=1 Tax=Thanatephorus cucumeris (strain AG1-IA) TaxID=983506 RepID=L8WST9_THACA|nr:hypothetical protein AG1IA_06191 [Rhizoctonia solani AG-1 IA]
MESSSSRADIDQPPPRSAAEMTTKATTGCFIVLLATVLSVVWHRRQRWRRARPWLTKLRAEAANKIEKERSDIHKETTRSNDIKEAPKDVPKDKASEKERKGKERNIPAETKSDGSSVGKRAKERRRRGRESKPTRTASAALISNSQTRPPANQLNETHAQPSHDSPSSPFLVPLPPSPVLPPADSSMPPTLLLSPTSPISTSFSTLTEITVTTPTTSTSTSPAPTPPAFLTNSNANAKVPSSKLPAFPPASPLPPNLARKPPPRRLMPNEEVAKKAKRLSFPLSITGPRRERTSPREGQRLAENPVMPLNPDRLAQRSLGSCPIERRRSCRRKTDVAKKGTRVNQLSHQLHALTVAFATGGGQGYPPYGYGYGTAYDPSQPTTPISKPELPSSEQAPTVDQSHTPKDPLGSVVPPSPAGTTRTPGPAYPTPYPYHPYAQYPLFVPPQPHPQSQMIMASTPMMSPPAQHGNMSPPQASPYLFSAHPWNAIHRGGSPMRSPVHSIPGMMHPIPGRHPYSGFYTGSPRRGGSRPRRQGTGTPSTPSVGSVDDSLPLPTPDTTLPGASADTWIPPREDYVPLREDYVPIPPPPSGLKREREPETDEALSSSEDESDEDSVIFEDGSVGDSVNLSLHGGDGLRDKGKDLEVAAPVRIRVGEEIM